MERLEVDVHGYVYPNNGAPGKWLTPAEGFLMMKHMSDALAWLQRKHNIAHLDLKPGNIGMNFSPSARPGQGAKKVPTFKLLDFGSSQSTKVKETRLNNFGTPCFRRRELVQHQYSSTTDSWSLLSTALWSTNADRRMVALMGNYEEENEPRYQTALEGLTSDHGTLADWADMGDADPTARPTPEMIDLRVALLMELPAKFHALWPGDRKQRNQALADKVATMRPQYLVPQLKRDHWPLFNQLRPLLPRIAARYLTLRDAGQVE